MMIEVSPWRDGSDEYVLTELSFGRGVQFYCMDYRKLKAWRDEKFPEADIWYTERNGDPIGMWVPKGTPPEELPDMALDYMAIEWIDPDKDFGTGYLVPRWQTSAA
jgi:hypothetical protein